MYAQICSQCEQDINVGFWKKKCWAEHRSCWKCFQQCNHCITQGTASRGWRRTDSNCSHQDKKYNLEIIFSHYVDHVLGDFQPKWCRISNFPHTFSASHLVYVTSKLKKNKRNNNPNYSKRRLEFPNYVIVSNPSYLTSLISKYFYRYFASVFYKYLNIIHLVSVKPRKMSSFDYWFQCKPQYIAYILHVGVFGHSAACRKC